MYRQVFVIAVSAAVLCAFILPASCARHFNYRPIIGKNKHFVLFFFFLHLIGECWMCDANACGTCLDDGIFIRTHIIFRLDASHFFDVNLLECSGLFSYYIYIKWYFVCNALSW